MTIHTIEFDMLNAYKYVKYVYVMFTHLYYTHTSKFWLNVNALIIC